MKERYIGENVRLILPIIDYLEINKQPGLLFFAVFQKAFDSLSHTFIIGCLKDARSVSFRSELFTSYILTIFKQRNLLP